MTLHLRKLCVGADSVRELADWQAMRLESQGSIGHVTRMWPTRRDEILAGGGSLYWIVRGVLRCRQRILGFEPWWGTTRYEDGEADPDRKPRCRILLEPGLVLTEPWPHRPFQGWRYLAPEEAPPDLPEAGEGDDSLPLELASELRQIGVI